MRSEPSKVGRRLGEPPAPEIVALSEARIRGELAHIELLTQNNEAHVVMLCQQGIIDRGTARTLLAALAEIRAAGPEALPIDPEREDLFFNYEHEVIRRTGADVGGRMHLGRSRNDLFAALDAVRVRSHLTDLIEAALALRAALLDRAAEHVETVMPGYTHMQPAQPITFAHYLCGIETALSRDVDRLLSALARGDRSPMGAAALAGTGYPIDREAMAELLGFSAVAANTLDAVASRDVVLEAVAAATIMGTTLARFGQDLYVWYTHEFAMVDLPDRIGSTSSIMPQKKNPTVLEQMKGRSAEALGALVTAASAIRATPFTHTSDGSRVALEGVWPALDRTQQTVDLARLVTRSAVVRRETMAARAAIGFSTVTQLADLLVAAWRISFREAHEIVGALVRRCIEHGLQAADIDGALVTAVAEESGIARSIGDQEVKRALDPMENVRSRAHLGGPAPTAVQDAIRSARSDLERDRRVLEEFEERLRTRSRRLQGRVSELLSS